MHSWMEAHSGNSAAQAATGERFSAEIVARLTGRVFLDPATLVSINRDRTPDANVTVNNLRGAIDPSKRYVLPGFYGYDNNGAVGRVQILDRGGSDTSGALVAAALNIPYANFTDVDGFYTTDPRINQRAQKINNLTYEEARALALGGSKLLHPEVARIMRGSGLTTTVRNTFDPSSTGTRITKDVEGSRTNVVGVASRKVLALDIRKTGMDESVGVMNNVYDALAEEGVPYLLSNDGSDETAIFFDFDAVADPVKLGEIAERAVSDAEITVSEFGLVVGVLARNRAYVRAFIEVATAAAKVDESVMPSSSLSQQSIELFTNPKLVVDVEAAVHELVA